jgi:anti-anti-sigma factor
MPELELQHIHCQVERGVLVITITERQVGGDDLAAALRREFFSALDEYQLNKVALDFQEVQLLFSAGLRPLLSLHRRLGEAGGAMVLCNLAPQVAETLQVTRLISSKGASAAPFDTAATLDEALARLQSP